MASARRIDARADLPRSFAGLGRRAAVSVAIGTVAVVVTAAANDGLVLTDAATTVGYAAVLTMLAWIDTRRRVIPNRIVYPALTVVLTAAVANGSQPFMSALFGSAIAAAPFVLRFVLAPRSIGGGDVKMAGLVGGIAGMPGVLEALLVAAFGGGVVAVAALAIRNARGGMIPYGPFLALGGIIALR